jgi:hypothetical protein
MVAGSMSSTASLMKRKEAPQIAARRKSKGQYRRMRGGYRGAPPLPEVAVEARG